MKAKTITAKIRDAVQVCFMVDGDEMARYKNIEIPAMLKELEIRDFGFMTTADGKIDFNLYFEPGVLPQKFPEPRPKVTRAEKAEAKAAMKAEQEAAPEAQDAAQEAPTEAEPAQEMETPDEAASAPEMA